MDNILVNRNLVGGVPLRHLTQQLWMLKINKAYVCQTYSSVVSDLKSGLGGPLLCPNRTLLMFFLFNSHKR